MTYRHGVYLSETPTSVLPPVDTVAGLPVVFGTAPINLSKGQRTIDLTALHSKLKTGIDIKKIGKIRNIITATAEAPVNIPVLCYTYADAAEQLGYSDDFDSYTLCEFMSSHFALFNAAPVVLINVLDPNNEDHVAVKKNQTVVLTEGKGKTADKGILLSKLVVKLVEAGQSLVYGTDYLAAFDTDGYVQISAVKGGKILDTQKSLIVDYSALNPDGVVADDIIGGVDADTGAYRGLELLNRVFPKFGLVPGQVLAPKWSTDAEVAAVMTAKASNINGFFKCIALVDIPTGEVKKYQDASSWKNTNNYTSEREIVCWPKVKLNGKQYHLSTQIAGINSRTDAGNDDVPNVSPSNKSLQSNGAVLADGAEVLLGPEQANYLNSQGIVTALNFIGGWKAWGDETGCYPANTDVKDRFICVRRMFDWIGNTIVLTLWSKVDSPMKRRLVDTVIDSINSWFNGMTNAEQILGGRIVLLKDENPLVNLLDGTLKFHIYVSPTVPAKELDFVLEYDPSYFSALFE